MSLHVVGYDKQVGWSLLGLDSSTVTVLPVRLTTTGWELARGSIPVVDAGLLVATQHAADLLGDAGGAGGSGRSNRANTSRICGTVKAGIFPPEPILLQDQKPQRQQRKCHVAVPAHPASHLIVAQADIALARLQHLLDPVPPPVGLHHSGQRYVTGIRQGVPDLRFLGHRSDDHQPLQRPDPALLAFGLHPRLQRPHHSRTFGPVADHQATPT